MTGVKEIIWSGPVDDIGGYGNVSRNYLRSIRKANIPVKLLFNGQLGEGFSLEDKQLFESIPTISSLESIDYQSSILILHGLPEGYPAFQHYPFYKKIGITLFETDRIPLPWVEACNRMDEIWVPTQFNVRTFTATGVNPSKMRVIHYGINSEKFNQPFSPYFFPPEVKSFRFLYTLVFDFRKDLDLLIASYCEEFSALENVTLLLKIFIPADSEMQHYLNIISSYIPQKPENPHIHLILEKLPENQLLSLYSSSTCYISTERACGWGMPQMEMMAMGKPVISINWGGPTEYMSERNAFLIEPQQELIDVARDLQIKRAYHYSGHKCPNVLKSSVRIKMREAFENHQKREEVALQARQDIQNKFSLEAIANQISEALR